MDYAATHQHIFLQYYASNMILHVDSDDTYLMAPQAKRRIAGHFFFPQHYSNNQAINHPSLVECKYIRHVVASAAEVEAGGLFHNTQTTIPFRLILHRLGHSQHPTPIKTGNTTACNFVHDNIHLRKFKTRYMHYHWSRDREN